MPWYPGATRRPVARYQPGGSSHRSTFDARRLILHTAVSNATPSMYSFFAVPGRATSHFYIGEDGEVEQYIDTDHGSTANLEGNPDCITVETWDGYGESWFGGSPGPKWTPKQCEALAKLAAWSHAAHDIPLVHLPSSKPGTRGIGWHRQGIDGNFPPGLLSGRVAGGERWSTSSGKVCPTDTRIKQVDGIIARAVELLEPPRVEFSAMATNWDQFNTRLDDMTDGELVERVHPMVVLACELKDRRLAKVLPSYEVMQAPKTDQPRANSAVAWDPGRMTCIRAGYDLLVEPDDEEMLTRHIAWCDLERDGVTQRFGALHMPKREFQANLWAPALAALHLFIAESPYPVVLGGDWNRPMGGGRIKLGDTQMVGVGIDGFAVPADYEVLRVRQITETESDHNFVLARFATPGGTR